MKNNKTQEIETQYGLNLLLPMPRRKLKTNMGGYFSN